MCLLQTLAHVSFGSSSDERPTASAPNRSFLEFLESLSWSAILPRVVTARHAPMGGLSRDHERDRALVLRESLRSAVDAWTSSACSSFLVSHSQLRGPSR